MKERFQIQNSLGHSKFRKLFLQDNYSKFQIHKTYIPVYSAQDSLSTMGKPVIFP
jgi:hypothetical protein